eukprot:56103-Eustigmatos_ZCMA.PRE.1
MALTRLVLHLTNAIFLLKTFCVASSQRHQQFKLPSQVIQACLPGRCEYVDICCYTRTNAGSASTVWRHRPKSLDSEAIGGPEEATRVPNCMRGSEPMLASFPSISIVAYTD